MDSCFSILLGGAAGPSPTLLLSPVLRSRRRVLDEQHLPSIGPIGDDSDNGGDGGELHLPSKPKEQQRRGKGQNRSTSWFSFPALYAPDDEASASDDETASTRSTSTSSFDDEDRGFKSVTFAAPLVTMVTTRPYTTRAERPLLFYHDLDYRAFKYAWIHRMNDDEEEEDSNRRKRSSRRVSFDQTPTKIHMVPAHGGRLKKSLFYSDSELQGFLDDFVMSLNQRSTR